MSIFDPKRLEGKALEVILKLEKAKNLLIAHTEEDKAESSGKRLFRFHARKEDEPNGPHFSVVLDESGAVADVKELSKAEGRPLFSVPKTDVDLSAIISAVASAPITINPTVNDLVLNLGDTFNETITVTVPKNVGVSKADVYILADRTGSMSTILNAVQAGAINIVNSPALAGLDIAFGVGNYEDFPQDAANPVFTHQLAPSKVTADIVNAINGWVLGNGNDGSEGQFFALNRLAEAPGGPIGWRADSKRIIVWFGDAPGHDPICAGISGEAADITEATVTSKLVAENISVIAISTNTSLPLFPAGLDDDPKKSATDYAVCGAPGGTPGQATRISTATHGAFAAGIDATTVVNTIIKLLADVVGKINNLNLVPTGATAPFVASISPAGGYGPLSGKEEHVLKFDVTFKGIEACKPDDQIFTGTLDVVADRSVVARKRVRITVPACKFVYSVKFVCGAQPDCDCECSPVRPGVYATEINIHNDNDGETRLEKHVIPVVFAGAAAGREPNFARRRATDKLVLPPHTATMDDCCRITELLLGAPSCSPAALNIGFLEIISNREISVTAVYTVSDLKSKSVSIDVEQITGKVKKGS
jgi:hypothetical protein